MKTKWIHIIAGFLLVAILAGGCSQNSSEKEESGTK